MINLGLTFSGGGGKGAYEIGVWKALKEYGIDQFVKSISGTSIGALNAALFIGGDLESAESAWKNISHESILIPNTKGIIDYLSSIDIAFAKPSAMWLEKAISNYVGTGVFSQKGLEKLIRDNVDFQAIRASKIPLHVCAVNTLSLRPEYIKLNDQTEADIIKYLLASAAIPFIFDKVEVKGQRYYDGGLPIIGDNTPIGPVIASGCDTIITVILDQGTSIYDQEQKYPNTKLWTLVPLDDQGGLKGTVDFNPDHAKRRIAQGYEDTRKQLQRLYEFLLVEQKFVKSVEEIATIDRDFRVSVKTNRLLREGAQKNIEGVKQNQTALQYLLNSGDKTNPQLSSGLGKIAPISNENDLQEAIKNSLSISEQKVLSNSLDETIEKFKDNSGATLALVMEGIAALSPVPGRIKHIMNQGVLKSIWRSISGKNSKLLAENQNSLYKAIYTNQELIKKLSEKHLLTMDILKVYGNNFKYLQDQINRLNLNTIIVAESLQMLQHTVDLIFQQITLKFKNDDERIQHLEGRVELVEWRTSLKGQKVNGVLLKNLPLTEKVGRVVSQLTNLANGKSLPGYYPQLEAALADLDIDETQQINPVEFCIDMYKESNFEQDFMRETGLPEPISRLPESDWQHFPILKGIEWVLQNNTAEQNEFRPLLQHRMDISTSVKINAVDFAVELFYSINSLHQLNRRDTKAQLLEILGECKIIEAQANSQQYFSDKIDEFILAIEEYSIKIPIIGPFTAGKSTLINRFFRTQVLPTSLLAETALATELYYSESEKVSVEYLDGSSEEYAPIDMDFVKNHASECILSEQLRANSMIL